MIGQTISHYKILEKLGEGGMGVVYKAQDLKLDRLVALKFLPPNVSSSAEDKARFMQEAKAAASLSHPNICTIYGVEEHDGPAPVPQGGASAGDYTFIAMEYVEGKTLKDMKDNITLKQAIDIGIQLTDGLATAHEKGIVHRDIKPENIMMRKDGRVQIMDFGLAKLKGVSRLTKEGSTVGTAGYMSPEQVQGQDTDHRTDIFSMGVVLYELFSGQTPFKGIHETAISYEIVNVDPQPISAIKPEISPELDVIVLECLAKEPAERYQWAAEIGKDLRRFKRESSKKHLSRITAAKAIYRPSEIEAAEAEAPAVAVPKKWFTVERLAAGTLFLAFIALALIHLTETSPDTRVYRWTLAPPEKTVFTTAFGGHIALSPDGRMVAFVARDSSGKTLLWVKSLSALAGQPLLGTDDATFPFWSPDSRSIGFAAGGKLKKIVVSGGPPVTICDAPVGRGGTWNQDGTIIFCPSNSQLIVLFRVPAEGGMPVPITKLDSTRNEFGHRWPNFLPDGKHFFYVARTVPGGVGELDAIILASLDSTFKPRLLLNASSSMAYSNGYLLFVRERTLMARPFDDKDLEFTGEAFPIAEQVQFEPFTSKAAFSVSDNGILAYQTGAGTTSVRLFWIDRRGKQIGSIGQSSVYNDLRISPDGKRVAISLLDTKVSNTDIWLYEAGRPGLTRFTFDPASERWPIWSPGGETIVFRSFGKGRKGLYLRSSSGAGNEELLFESNVDKAPSDWSHDGKLLAFSAPDARMRSDIWILPMQGERKPFVFLQTEFDEDRAAFSPDGHWLAYQSNESRTDQIYVRPFPGPGGEWQISTNGGSRPRWRRDGKELFFLGADDKIWAAGIKLGATTVEVDSVRPMFQIRPFGGAARDIYDVTADGQRFLVATPSTEESSSPITLVVNWPAEVKKK